MNNDPMADVTMTEFQQAAAAAEAWHGGMYGQMRPFAEWSPTAQRPWVAAIRAANRAMVCNSLDQVRQERDAALARVQDLEKELRRILDRWAR